MLRVPFRKIGLFQRGFCITISLHTIRLNRRAFVESLAYADTGALEAKAVVSGTAELGAAN
ncbi:MAG: hypothetical protein ACI9AX_001214, partial [Polaromonas sp.]